MRGWIGLALLFSLVSLAAQAAATEKYDIVCPLTGHHDEGIASRPFVRTYSVDFASMNMCDISHSKCKYLSRFVLENENVVLNHTLDPSDDGDIGYHYVFDPRTNRLTEESVLGKALTSDGKSHHQTMSGVCTRRAFTPWDASAEPSY